MVSLSLFEVVCGWSWLLNNTLLSPDLELLLKYPYYWFLFALEFIPAINCADTDRPTDI